MFRNATPAGHRSSRLASALRAIGALFQMASGGISAPARTTLPTLKSDGPERMPARRVNWEARALRLHNRNAKQALTYKARHMILEAGHADG